MSLNLVIQTAFLGDLLLSIPLLKEIRALYPQDQLGLVCRKGFGDFFKKTGLVDHCFEIQKGQSDSYKKIQKDLEPFSIRYLISPHESLRTAFFVRGLKAEHKIGYKNLWSFFAYNERQKKDLRLPDAIRQMSLLSGLSSDLKNKISEYLKTQNPYQLQEDGHLPVPPNWSSMEARKSVLDGTDVFKKLKNEYPLAAFEEGRAVLLFPGSVWATKRWTEKGFVSVGVDLQKKGYQVYVMGGPGEEKLAETVALQIPGSICFAGKTSIFESAQLIVRAKVLVGNDSASTHLAAVCGTPHIAIFGPTVLEFGFRPWGQQSYVVELGKLPCRPCGKHGHHKCPIGTHECMEKISPKVVIKSLDKILSS